MEHIKSWLNTDGISVNIAGRFTAEHLGGDHLMVYIIKSDQPNFPVGCSGYSYQSGLAPRGSVCDSKYDWQTL